VTWKAAAEFLTVLARSDGDRLKLAIAYARAILAETDEGSLALAVLDGGPDAVTRAVELAQHRLIRASAVTADRAGTKVVVLRDWSGARSCEKAVGCAVPSVA
jgi:hypothetical protein